MNWIKTEYPIEMQQRQVWPHECAGRPRTKSPAKIGVAGMTLIEILVVIALVGLLTFVAMPTIGNYFKISINSATREMASLIKEGYNATVITGKVHRLVYDLKQQTYWIEVSSATGAGSVLLDTEETLEKEKRRKRFAKSTEAEEASQQQSNTFSMDKSLTRKEKPLPRGVEFEDIFTERSTDPIKEGKVYTHFFPHGMTEQTLIHLKDGTDHHTSLVVSPLIGRTTVYDRYITIKEAFETNER